MPASEVNLLMFSKRVTPQPFGLSLSKPALRLSKPVLSLSKGGPSTGSGRTDQRLSPFRKVSIDSAVDRLFPGISRMHTHIGTHYPDRLMSDSATHPRGPCGQTLA